MKSGAALAGCLGLVLACLGGCGGGSTSVTAPPGAPASIPEVLTITSNSSLQCVLTVPFTTTLQVQGASGTVTWTLTAGQLPTGLSLDSSTGVISGTPTGGGILAPTISVSDGKATTSKQFAFVVWGKLGINSAIPPPAHLNAPYSFAIVVSAAIGNWTISGGQLPPGLSLMESPSSAAVILVTGTPSQTGSYTFTVQVQDNTLPQTASEAFTIVVDSHLTITKSGLKNGGQNQAYTDAFASVNGIPPYQWSITGGLASGLTLNFGTGQITGIPTNFGSFPYTVSVTDSSSPPQQDSGQGILSVAQQLHIVGTLTPAYIGQFYGGILVALGGNSPYTWIVASGALPGGLSLQTDGQIFGTATQLGTYNLTLQVTDSSSPPYVLTDAIAFQVVPQPLSAPASPASPAPVNVVYHSQIPASGGTPPYNWSLSSGELPLGLSLTGTTGDIDGTPTQIGTYNFVATITDSGTPQQTATVNGFILIRTPLGRNDTIATATPLGNSANVQPQTVLSISPYIDPMNAPAANPDTDYYKLLANGGSIVHVETFAQRSWGVDTLDSVLEVVDGNGQREQTCTRPSYVSSCINDNIDASTLDSALDFQVPGPSTVQTTFYVHVFDWRGDARPDMQYYLNLSGVIEPLGISLASLGPGATRGVSYQRQLTAKGGTGTMNWTVDTGSLPPGWSLSSSGLLSGVATTDGSYTFAVKATDSGNPAQTARAQYTLEIAEPVAITSPSTLPNACANQPYSFTVQTSGGIPPFTYSFYSSDWPTINLDVSTGVSTPTFRGTSSILGTFTGRFGVIDSAQPPSQQGQIITLTVVTCP